MPNNFKLVGDYYVSKAGNDSNNGLTPETPKRTIQAGLSLITTTNKTLVVGSGVYSETLSLVLSNLKATILADGVVVLDGRNYFTATFACNNSGGVGVEVTIRGIEFRNYPAINVTNQNSNGNGPQLYSCTFKNSTIYNGAYLIGGLTYTLFENCIFINCTGAPYQPSLFTSQYGQFFRGCTLINSTFANLNTYNINAFLNSYVDLTSVISVRSDITAANFNYNNIRGTVIVYVASSVTSGVIQDTYGRYYNLSIATSTGDGTIGNPYGRPYTNGAGFNFANHRIAYPTMNANSSAVDPGFNNILKQDFSLQSSSLMVGRANNFIDNVGGTYVATRVDASGSLFSGSNATTDNFVFNSGDYVISGSAVTGSVTSAPIFISSSAKVIQEIDYNGLLAFNKDTTAPTGSNVNVPDVLTYTSASNQPGANPDRLTYYMRWTTGSSQPVSDAQWENGGLWPAGSFNTFEWNTKPAVDFLGRGNGDQNFNIVNTPTYVKATWIQLRVSLRNDYLI